MPGPIDTVNELVQAINRADLERAVAAYENGAVLVAQPGQLARGTAQLREALAGRCERLVGSRGFVLDKDVGARDYRALYFGSSANRMRGYEFYRIAVAHVAASTPDIRQAAQQELQPTPLLPNAKR